MKFEWDEEKNLANIKKHCVSFEEAMLAFLDPKRKILFNDKHSTTEMRYYCLGKVGDKILTVRFTIRGSKIRIIGAGYWREGKKRYEQKD
ncbi:MAG: BrnT family toxin [Chitinispirillaceae bacterium]|nr:BrnT family toxin [Chitinispirillaceae bacterium]